MQRTVRIYFHLCIFLSVVVVAVVGLALLCFVSRFVAICFAFGLCVFFSQSSLLWNVFFLLFLARSLRQYHGELNSNALNMHGALSQLPSI